MNKWNEPGYIVNPKPEAWLKENPDKATTQFKLGFKGNASWQKILKAALAVAVLASPLSFAIDNNSNITAVVHLQLQLPDNDTDVGQFAAVATDTLTHQKYIGVTDADNGKADFYQLGTPVMDKKPILPAGYDLLPVFPNPFNPSTNLRFKVPKATDVSIDIYNSEGRLVKRLVDQNVGPGIYQVGWDGTDKDGSGTASGVYLAKMIAGNFVKTLKMAKVDGGAPGSDSELIKVGDTSALGKSASVNDAGAVYRFDIAGQNIEPVSLVQRIIQDTSMTVPVQGKITGNLGPVSFNEADSTQVYLSSKVNATFGVSGYRLENVDGNLAAVLDDGLLKIKGKNGDVNGSFLSDLVIRDNHGTKKRIQFPTTINPMTDIPIRTFDVQYLKRRIAGAVGGIPASIVIEGKIYNTDANGLLNLQVEPKDSVEVKVSAIKDNNPESFESLFWIPVKADYSKMLNIPVISYDSLSYNTTIPISPQTFKDFAAEGVFNPQNGAYYPGLKSFDWTRKYKEWISAGQTEKEYPTVYSTYTPEKQQQISQNIVQLQHTSFVDSSYVPEILIASP